MTVIVTHNKVSAVADSGDTTLVQPSDWNANHTISGLGTAASLDAGVANGVATLDSSGKVPTSQIPLQGDLNYQGAWNASTNTPTLTSSVGTKGYYYVVSVAGTTNLNGITDWQIGDWAVFNGSIWQKIDNTDAVTSVNGYTGTVVLNYSDVGAQPAGTYVTSVGATSPVTSTGGTTPTIAIPQSSGSASGYLSSTDWNTFNNKGSGSVTSVSGTGSVSGITLSGTVTSTGNLTLGGALDLSSPPVIGGTTPAAITGTIVTATNKFVGSYFDASGSGGGSLRNASGTAVFQWGGGGGTNITVSAAININPANQQVDISPTGTGSVNIHPVGGLNISPIAVGTMDNVTIGATTPLAITGTTITATTQFSGAGTGLTGTASSLSIGGNAATVTNGVYTTGSYANPTWITSLAGSKITGQIDGGTF